VIRLGDVDGLTAADLVHGRSSTLPGTSTVGELRAYFAESSSRQLAVLVDRDRFVGSVGRGELPDDVEASAAGADFADRGPVIEASRAAREARDAALATPSARVAVVDTGGALVGVVALNHRRDGFCGT
jgi:CBS-domain-containing membrane protein